MVQLSDFHDVQFPVDVAIGSSGGPQRSTEIVTLGSGKEQRNQRWSRSRRRFDAGYGVKSLDALHEVIAFFEARRGSLIGFRYRDATDCKSCSPSHFPTHADQKIGTGDGATTAFQLIKLYGSGEEAYTRCITHPVNGSVLIALNGSAQIPGDDFAIDHLSGVVNFVLPPGTGVEITAGYRFDVPVRFDTDTLEMNLAAFSAGNLPSIPLIEVQT